MNTITRENLIPDPSKFFEKRKITQDWKVGELEKAVIKCLKNGICFVPQISDEISAKEGSVRGVLRRLASDGFVDSEVCKYKKTAKKYFLIKSRMHQKKVGLSRMDRTKIDAKVALSSGPLSIDQIANAISLSINYTRTVIGEMCKSGEVVRLSDRGPKGSFMYKVAR